MSSHRTKKPNPTNPLDLSRLLRDDVQQARFISRYLERPIMTPKYGSLSSFDAHQCTFTELIRDQALHVFVEDKGHYFPELMKAFYCNLEIIDGSLISWVKGKQIHLTLQEFAECLNLPSLGADLGPLLPCPWVNFISRDFYFSLCRFSEAEISRKRQRVATSSKRETLGVGNLTVEHRLLHYFLVYIIYQRTSNFAIVTEFDLELLYGLVHKESINWASVIMHNMFIQTTKTTPLPYALAITRILKKFRVDFTNELKVGVTIQENQIDITSIGRMQINISSDGLLRWHDEVASAEEEGQTDQGVIEAPTLTMVMNELRSMRQFMTAQFEDLTQNMDNRFDQIVLDTESLRCDIGELSHRIDMMDMGDDDATTPASP